MTRIFMHISISKKSFYFSRITLTIMDFASVQANKDTASKSVNLVSLLE